VERATQRLLIFFAVLFIGLIGQLTYVQVWAAPGLRARPSNTRSLEAERAVERGAIVSADGVVLASSRKDGRYFVREYPEGALVEPWMGYTSLRYGRAGLERVYNDVLSGESSLLSVRTYLDMLTGKPQRGADLQLTLAMNVQRAAAEALGDRVGAVVAIDPTTGAILALVSSPRYDPNTLDADWKTLNADPARPLVDRALQGLYPPGSSFKPVVAGAALQEGRVQPTTPFVDTGTYVAGGYPVHNYDDKAYGEHDFTGALVKSINTTFAKVGVDVGADILARYAGQFGFNRAVPGSLSIARSSFPDPARMDVAHVAQASFGQGEVLATPLEMALVAAGVGNGGQIMRPYLVAQIKDYLQTVLVTTQPGVWLRPLTPATAAQVRDMMVGVVNEGTGTAAAIPGVTVAGKTGTAEVDSGEPHAWFIGFAPAEAPRVAVAVIVEHGGTGGSAAAPIARAVMAAALGK
jgi:peptidoglycan glycosyltransferase